MIRHLKKKFTVSFEIEAKADLDLIESGAGLIAALGSFRMGSPMSSLFKTHPAKTHYQFSRLSITSAVPANAGLERHAASLFNKLDVSRLRRIQADLTDCRFLLRIGVFYLAEPPQVLLPSSMMRLAVNTNAQLTLDYYHCSSMAPPSSRERLIRARLMRHLRQDLKSGEVKPIKVR